MSSSHENSALLKDESDLAPETLSSSNSNPTSHSEGGADGDKNKTDEQDRKDKQDKTVDASSDENTSASSNSEQKDKTANAKPAPEADEKAGKQAAEQDAGDDPAPASQTPETKAAESANPERSNPDAQPDAQSCEPGAKELVSAKAAPADTPPTKKHSLKRVIKLDERPSFTLNEFQNRELQSAETKKEASKNEDGSANSAALSAQSNVHYKQALPGLNSSHLSYPLNFTALQSTAHPSPEPQKRHAAHPHGKDGDMHHELTLAERNALEKQRSLQADMPQNKAAQNEAAQNKAAQNKAAQNKDATEYAQKSLAHISSLAESLKKVQVDEPPAEDPATSTAKEPASEAELSPPHSTEQKVAENTQRLMRALMEQEQQQRLLAEQYAAQAEPMADHFEGENTLSHHAFLGEDENMIMPTEAAYDDVPFSGPVHSRDGAQYHENNITQPLLHQPGWNKVQDLPVCVDITIEQKQDYAHAAEQDSPPVATPVFLAQNTQNTAPQQQADIHPAPEENTEPAVPLTVMVSPTPLQDGAEYNSSDYNHNEDEAAHQVAHHDHHEYYAAHNNQDNQNNQSAHAADLPLVPVPSPQNSAPLNADAINEAPANPGMMHKVKSKIAKLFNHKTQQNSLPPYGDKNTPDEPPHGNNPWLGGTITGMLGGLVLAGAVGGAIMFISYETKSWNKHLSLSAENTSGQKSQSRIAPTPERPKTPEQTAALAPAPAPKPTSAQTTQASQTTQTSQTTQASGHRSNGAAPQLAHTKPVHSAPQKAQPANIPPPPPFIAAQAPSPARHFQGITGQKLKLDLALPAQIEPKTAMVQLTDLAAGTLFSSGFQTGRQSWVVPITNLAQLLMTPPPNFTGQFTFKAQVLSQDGNTELTPIQTYRVSIAAPTQPPALSAPGPVRAHAAKAPALQQNNSFIAAANAAPALRQSPPHAATAHRAAAPTHKVSPFTREELNLLVRQGNRFLSQGNISAARQLYIQAVETGDPVAAFAYGRSFDPNYLKNIPNGVAFANPRKATQWYRAAAKGGVEIAREGLSKLRVLLSQKNSQ